MHFPRRTLGSIPPSSTWWVVRLGWNMYPRLKGHVVPHIRRLLASLIMEHSRGNIYLKQCWDVPSLGNRARTLILWSGCIRRSKKLLCSLKGVKSRASTWPLVARCRGVKSRTSTWSLFVSSHIRVQSLWPPGRWFRDATLRPNPLGLVVNMQSVRSTLLHLGILNTWDCRKQLQVCMLSPIRGQIFILVVAGHP